MPKQEVWDELFPDGFRNTYSMRHMPKDLHKRLGRLANELEVSSELLLVQCAYVGLEQLEIEVYAGDMPDVTG